MAVQIILRVVIHAIANVCVVRERIKHCKGVSIPTKYNPMKMAKTTLTLVNGLVENRIA